MMSLPFFTATVAMVMGWCGLRAAAAWVGLLTVVVTLALFATHATSSINIAL
ncbi:DUF5993 family protein [Acuticoccus sp. I52.16.1]|uniref:DUF5993 family protein n=1 Tax=Acuticoccus sp. I52.16.1 TaxID=2928472 RepID=UPI001FD0D28A|nr:DUF5993 family protein [Acuticoccus sp. I52.16.1]UOM36495.1 DUF5993 family protein [Acuticoccus sp. I52.16.1]